MSVPAQELMAIDEASFFLGNPYPVFARLRRDSPVYWYEGAECWVLLKHEDIKHASTRPTVFSSARGIFPGDNLHPERTSPEAMGSDNLIRTDPPRHGELRRLVNKAFTPRYVSQLVPAIEQLADEAIDALPGDGPIDFVDGVAVPVSMYVIADMLGVPRADRQDFKRWSDAALGATLALTPEAFAAIKQANAEMSTYFAAVLDQRRAHPTDDLMTRLLQAEEKGVRLSGGNMITMLRVLLAAGNETTRNFLSTSLYELWAHPDQRQKLADQPDLIPTAIDELVRWVTPVRTMARTATEDVDIRGQRISAGDYVVFAYSSANRDEDIWADPDRLDVTRSPDPMHVAFGFGEHLCLGANLARLEAQIVLTKFLQRFPCYEITQEPERLNSALINGLVRLDVQRTAT